MSAKTEADVTELKSQMATLYGAVHALLERIEALEGRENAVVEGDDIVPEKAAPNGKVKKAHR